MPLMKVCVPCSAGVHVRKSVCACGHVFASIKSSPLVTKTSKRVAIDRRSLESEDEIAARKAKTALEKQRNVPQGSFCRVIEHVLPKKRAFETQEVTLHRQERNRDTCAAKKESC